MEFGLRVNPGLEAREFLENKINSLREMGPQEGLPKLSEDIRLIFNGRFDKLQKDTRFKQVFLNPRINIRLEKTSLGETLIGAFAILESLFSDKLSGAAGKEDRPAVEAEFFEAELNALEKLFAGDINTFDHYFILMFLRYTYQDHRVEGQKLDLIKQRFKGFVSEEDTLLKFFFYLDLFNTLNIERSSIDQAKKVSLSQQLEDEINSGEPVKNLKRQVVICRMLKALAQKLVEISEGHNPLDEVRRVLDEVYLADGSENVIKGMLEKFKIYYELELQVTLEALVYKRIIFMNAGAKAAKANRKQWLQELDFSTVESLIGLLDVKDPTGRLTREQETQKELFEKYSKLLEDYKNSHPEEETKENILDEGQLNLLILRLSNVSQLEDQISRAADKLEAYRKKNSIDYQNNVIRVYNENIKRLTQCLYFFIEVSAFKRVALEQRAKQIVETIKQEIAQLQESNRGESPADEVAAVPEEEFVKEPDNGQAEETSEKEEPENTDPDLEKDPDKRAELLAMELKKLPDASKIKPLKELAYTGGLDTLKYILPLSQYSSEFLRNMARNAVIKIVLRLLKENEEHPILEIQQKQKLIDFVVGLDKKYTYLKDMELSSPKTTHKILDILIREDKDFTARTLSEIIVDEDDKVRATAVKLIADMLKQNESSLLMKMLNDPDGRVRANVIESLEAVGNRNVLGILVKFKFDKDNRARANALKAVWKFGHSEIVDSLTEMLVSQDSKMRASGVWVIGEIGHSQANLKALLEAVKTDKEPLVVDNLQRAMRKISRREEGLQVLVVDDDIKFCQDLCRKLKNDGYRATAAFNGKLALSSAGKQLPDIVLLDLRMPVMNGVEALKALKEDEKTREVPVIVMSDLNSSVLLKEVSRIGAEDYLLKPCSYDQVVVKLGAYI